MTPSYIVIIGCGRLGGLLANQLSSAGHSVVVVDHKEAAFGKLTAEFSGFRIHADAAEMATLRAAKVDQADCVLATTDKDNINLMVAQIARTTFAVPMVIARVYDPVYEALYRTLSIEIISPTRLSAEAFMQAVSNLQERQT
jgi:trk system potassium uptake protein